MRRGELEHLIRAAAMIVGESDIVVVGSQAILGEFPNAPDALLFSQEADIYPRVRPEKAIDIDGAMGDGSQFHDTFGYYAHGVGPETPKAPKGWEERLVPVQVPPVGSGDSYATGWCMEVHDLVLAKLVAGRERDVAFAEQAIRENMVNPEELLRRSADLTVDNDRREQVRILIKGIIASVAKLAL